MRYSRSLIEAHENGDCDSLTCPICEAEEGEE